MVVTTKTSKGETLIGGGRYAVEDTKSPRSAELAFLTGEGYPRARNREPALEASKAACRGRGRAAIRGRGACAKSAHACRLPAQRLADAAEPRGNVIHVTLALNQSRDNGLESERRTPSPTGASIFPSLDNNTATHRQPGTCAQMIMTRHHDRHAQEHPDDAPDQSPRRQAKG